MPAWFENYLAAWNSGDVEKVLEWMTDDIEFEDVGAGYKASGKQKLARFIAGSFTAFPGAQVDFVQGEDLGGAFFFEWIMQPTGIRGVSVGRLRDGKVAAERDYWDGRRLNVE